MQKRKLLALTLIMATTLNCVSCSKEKTKTKKRHKSETETVETVESTETSKTTETTRNTQNTEPVVETTSESTTPITESNDNPYAIEFLAEDLRYHYNLDLYLDTENNKVGGSVTIDFYNNSNDDWDSIALRDYPTYFGETTEIYNIVDHRMDADLSMERGGADSTVVYLPLTDTLKSGEYMTLSYDFEASLPIVNDRFGVDDENDIYNVTNFYPILDFYSNGEWGEEPYFPDGECFVSEISDYDVTLTLPSDMVIASTGEIISEQIDGDEKTVIMRAPCVRDFVFCASSNFNVVEQDCNGVNVRFVYDKDLESSVSALTSATFDSIEYTFDIAEDKLGMYPYKELDVVLSNMSSGNAGGMEYPNLVIITIYVSRNFIDQFTYEEILIHEVIHQWFMGIVGSNSGTEAWLDEGVTQYVSDSIFMDYNNASLGYSDSHYDTAIYDYYAEDGLLPISRRNVDFEFDDYVMAVYYITSQTLDCIHDYMGDELFYEFLHEYVQEYAFKNATGEDFFNLLLQYDDLDDEDLRYILKLCWEIDI